jgi:large subunit ribosomal protein L19
MQPLTTCTGFEVGMRKIAVAPQVQSTRKRCPDPVGAITAAQIATLDPTGARTRLFSEDNVDRARVGDILLVRQKDGDPFSGVCLNNTQGDSKIDSSILLRNNLTRVGVEMSYKIYSPNVEGIEVVQRKTKRARRARLYYMRQPRHDVGSVDSIVRQYMRQRAGGPMNGKNAKGRDAGAHKKKNNKKGRN